MLLECWTADFLSQALLRQSGHLRYGNARQSMCHRDSAYHARATAADFCAAAWPVFTPPLTSETDIGAIQELRWMASCSIYAKLADLGAAETEDAAKAFEAHQHLLAADLALGRLGNFEYRRTALHDIATGYPVHREDLKRIELHLERDGFPPFQRG